MFDDIDANIRKLLEGTQDVKYHEHIGGGHYVSVTTVFRCVDFRRWFLPHDEQDPKPTKKGVALRLDEWAFWNTRFLGRRGLDHVTKYCVLIGPHPS